MSDHIIDYSHAGEIKKVKIKNGKDCDNILDIQQLKIICEHKTIIISAELTISSGQTWFEFPDRNIIGLENRIIKNIIFGYNIEMSPSGRYENDNNHEIIIEFQQGEPYKFLLRSSCIYYVDAGIIDIKVY